MTRHETITQLAGTLPRRKIAPIVGMTPNHLSVYCYKHGISLKLTFEALCDDYKRQKAKKIARPDTPQAANRAQNILAR